MAKTSILTRCFAHLPETLPEVASRDEVKTIKRRLKMRREMRILMTAIVVTFVTGLGACVEPQTETAGAPIATAPAMRATPTPALTPFPSPANEGASSIPGAQPTLTSASNTPLPNAIPNDTRIVINAPAYRMDVFENGALVKSYLISIGYPEFPLPVGMRTADSIIFNPTWTPPDEPWVESPSSKVKVGQKVAAGSKLNPLGLVKIPIGLPSLIHGGKSPAQLGGFASHGCVGLTNAQVIDLSKRLAELGGVELTDDQIAQYRRKRTQTKNIALQWPILVELRYETMVVEDGKLRIYRDVYERGTNTEENLRYVLGAYGVALEDLSENERLQAAEALNQMGRNASGKAVPAAPLAPLIDAATDPLPDASLSKPWKEGSASRKVTRRVKGEKEMVVEITALAGKGYSVPVEFDSGKARPRQTAKSPATVTAREQR
jgi:lipoprotein-anchoring transpeptidase ErfK/SrfK